MGWTPEVHPLVDLARLAVETWVAEGQEIPSRALPEGLPERAGAFVTIRARGELRGCIGTIEPVMPTLAAEVIRNAIAAAVDDSRFAPVERRELPMLSYTVYVLNPPEPVAGIADLDPSRYGVVVQSGRRRGLLLPAIEGVDTAEAQVEIARRKARIPPQSPVELYRFSAVEYGK